MYVKIDYDSCISCGTCYKRCPQDVFSWDEEKNIPKVTYIEECWFCGCCWMDCPKRAIDITYPASFF